MINIFSQWAFCIIVFCLCNSSRVYIRHGYGTITVEGTPSIPTSNMPLRIHTTSALHAKVSA
eukprot:2818813-Amphidinium_carterae.1